MRSGFLMAAVLMETLSAPAFSRASMVSTLEIPPPTVKGMNRVFAIFLTRSMRIPRLSELAVMSRKTSSSAPSSLYFLPSSMGSPASFRSTKLVPLTTRPSLTSRQGMIRLLSMGLSLFRLCDPCNSLDRSLGVCLQVGLEWGLVCFLRFWPLIF